MFITKSGKSVNSLAELQEGMEWQDFLKENTDVWKKTMNALGYFFVEQKNSFLPIWLKKPIPPRYKNKKVQMFSSVDEYDSSFDNWMCENLLKEDSSIAFDGNWSPNFIPAQAYVLERKLLNWGKYKSKDTDYDLGGNGILGIKYFGSDLYQDIYKVGKSEPGIITEAFLEFIDNKNTLRRKV